MKKENNFFIKVDATDANNISVTITTTDSNEELLKSVPKLIDMLTTETAKQPEKPKVVELPKEWELEKEKIYYTITSDSTVIGYYPLQFSLKCDKDKFLLHSVESAKNVLALCQLLAMRDRYVGDWKPDWNDAREIKYCIVSKNCNLSVESWNAKLHTLSFPTRELAETFLNNFKSLIKEAGDLI